MWGDHQVLRLGGNKWKQKMLCIGISCLPEHLKIRSGDEINSLKELEFV